MFVGIDSVEISRIDSLKNKEGFIDRFFSESERLELSKRGLKSEHIAAAFAAKEAFSKVVGTGLSGFSLNEVSLLHEKSGRPYLKLSGSAEKLAFEKSLSFDVSVTHTESVATVIVIGFRGDGNE